MNCVQPIKDATEIQRKCLMALLHMNVAGHRAVTARAIANMVGTTPQIAGRALRHWWNECMVVDRGQDSHGAWYALDQRYLADVIRRTAGLLPDEISATTRGRIDYLEAQASARRRT